MTTTQNIPNRNRSPGNYTHNPRPPSFTTIDAQRQAKRSLKKITVAIAAGSKVQIIIPEWRNQSRNSMTSDSDQIRLAPPNSKPGLSPNYAIELKLPSFNNSTILKSKSFFAP
jgi:hypothetical protein